MFECSIIGSGAIRRYGFIGGGVALLEEACHCGGGALRIYIYIYIYIYAQGLPVWYRAPHLAACGSR